MLLVAWQSLLYRVRLMRSVAPYAVKHRANIRSSIAPFAVKHRTKYFRNKHMLMKFFMCIGAIAYV